MGKRELLLIVAFAAIGVVVYQVTAPPLPEGQQGFSLTQLWGRLSAEFKDQSFRLDARRSAAIDVAPGIKAVSVSGFRGNLTISGEDRPDIAAELLTDVFAGDEAEARTLAERVKITLAVQSETVVVTIDRPPARRRPRADLRLRLPARLAVRLETLGRGEVRNVGRVELATRLGQLTLTDIAGGVRGEHRDGDIQITGAGGLSLNVRRATVRAERVSGEVLGEYTDGRITLRDVSGRIAIECRRMEAEIENAAAEVHLTSTDAGAVVRNPSARVKFDGRRARLTLLPTKPVALDATSEDASVTLTFPPQGGVTLDLATEGGRIEIPAGELKASSTGTGEALAGAVAGGGPVWKVRTTRGDIVLHR